MQQFEALSIRVRESEVGIAQTVGVGHPAEHIVAMAERAGCDLIVLGRHRRSTLGRRMLGSTSERVLTFPRCAVTVVR